MSGFLDRVRDTFFADQRRYEYRGTLGRGVMGVVFRALDRELDVEIAIKVLVLGVDSFEDEAIARFKREVHLNRKVKHPNVARIHDLGVAGDLLYITMELIAGQPLSAILDAERTLPARRAVPILRQIALGSAAAHEHGIVHRDLKPQNVMVDDSGAVALLDFGIAHDLRAPGSRLTAEGELVGTPHYLAPEQLLDGLVDARSDLWAIGVIAFRTLTGKHPFYAENPLALCNAILTAPVPLALLEEAQVPTEVVAIVARCLAKEPAERYGSADELAMDLALADLDLVVASGPPDAPVPAPPSGPPPERRVLVVDDDENVRTALRHCIEEAGCQVLEAEDGQDALEQLQTAEIDLVLMDAVMPRLDGFDTTRILKAQPRFARLPVILMSAFPDRSRLAFGIQAGATEVVSKHDKVSLLLEKIARHLGRT